jgi:hypothetical protein
MVKYLVFKCSKFIVALTRAVMVGNHVSAVPLSMVLQPFGFWPLLQILNLIRRR